MDDLMNDANMSEDDNRQKQIEVTVTDIDPSAAHLSVSLFLLVLSFCVLIDIALFLSL
jgi:hypothetical protein